ncbi:hypothetical protein EMCG_06590 [[Emmonsia] crescens]|uniref:DUF6594 domain-containing protein n=1 Tax=[Emmonsia] crescens TaxID=73230 RepID=A0A0G2IB23_9EURO|nr:hypothetical protein EMCG_06590 [Emmonsia crescens UAMH 3008]
MKHTNTTEDEGESWMRYPQGFPRYAAFIAFDEDKSTTIYRRFDRLASRNLLKMESELAELELTQDQLDEDIHADLSNEFRASLVYATKLENYTSYDWEAEYGVFKRNVEWSNKLSPRKDGTQRLPPFEDEAYPWAVSLADVFGLEIHDPQYQPNIAYLNMKFRYMALEACNRLDRSNQRPDGWIRRLQEYIRNMNDEELGQKLIKLARIDPDPIFREVFRVIQLIHREAEALALPKGDRKKAWGPKDYQLVALTECARKAKLKFVAEERWRLAMDIKDKLDLYYNALKLQSEVLALSGPSRRPLKHTRRTFTNADSTGKPQIPIILGAMENHLDDGADLCVLAPPMEQDRLTQILEGRLSGLLTIFKSQSDGDVDYVSHSTVTTIVSTVSIILAAAFLLGAILALYLETDPGWRLFILFLFVVGFAGSLGALTNARRQDIFAGTAAYGAVLVVFVSGDLANSNNGGRSAAPPPPTGTPPPPSGSSLSTPAKVGIIAGCVFGSVTLGLSFFACWWTAKRRVTRRVIVRRHDKHEKAKSREAGVDLTNP